MVIRSNRPSRELKRGESVRVQGFTRFKGFKSSWFKGSRVGFKVRG